MDEFDEDPLDLLDDDGDGVIEMGLFLDDEAKNQQPASNQPSSSGCCVVFAAFGASIGMTAWAITHFWV